MTEICVELLVQGIFLNVFCYYRVQGVSKLVRNTCVDQRCKFVFSFELSIKNVVCYVHQLKNLHGLAFLKVYLDFELNILALVLITLIDLINILLQHFLV